MAKNTRKIDTSSSKQQPLFDTDLAEGSLDIVLGLKQLLSRLLQGYDRYLVAAQISKATLKDISKDSLDKLLSSNPDYQPSAIQVVAIGKIVNSFELLQYLADPQGGYVLPPEDGDLVEMARLQEERRKIDQRLQQIQTKRGMR
ncbi:MAG: hypothetical protein FIA89_14410 [Geobacter sp.]|nr:hypothetical protein [Geobacter sp.]